MALKTSPRLSTKIASPIIRSLIVKRAHLIKYLHLGMKRKLSLVTAPAGYGKTTLLGEWLASISKEDWPTAWITLDIDDNSSLRFWGYVSDALSMVNSEWQFELPKMGDISNDEIDPQLLASWINQINDNPTDFSLILDDYHTIQSDSIQNNLLYFITHMPQHMHLVIASRIKPKFPIAELRVKNQLIEISASDLEFSASESEIFLREVMGLNLTPEEIGVLIRTTEGWVAGLQMAALSIKNQPDANQWIKRFSDSQSYIFDYLTEAVLDVQDEAIQEFLLKTSILNELAAPLCDYLLDKNDSRKMLDYLENTNLFITPLGKERIWYRYHALFADTIKMRLERQYPPSIPELHLRAATWLKENGFTEKAIPHAISAGDLDLASMIIEESALQVINRLDFTTLKRWLNYLPEHYLWQRPVFWVYRALIETCLGNLDQVEDMLHCMETSFNYENKEKLSAEDLVSLHKNITAIQAAVDLQLGDSPQGISVAMNAINNLPEGDIFLSGWLYHNIGYAFEAIDDLEKALSSFKRGCENALKHNMPECYIFTKSEVSRILRIQGRLREAERELRHSLDYATQNNLEGGYVQLVKLALGDVLIEQNQIKTASDWVSEAVTYFNQVDIRQFGWLFTIKVYLYLADYYLQGDPVEAKKYLQKVRREIKNRNPFYFILSFFNDLQVRIWLAMEDISTILGWVKKKQNVLKSGRKLSTAEQISLVRILLIQGNPEAAIPFLLNIEKHSQETGRRKRLLETLILEAKAYHDLGEVEKSFDILNNALALAEPEGYIRIFVNEGATIKTMLSTMLTQINLYSDQIKLSPSKQYIKKILSAFDHSPQNAYFGESHEYQKPVIINPLVKPLSNRELQVLEYLREGKSAKEISTLLFVSYHTVKTHIRNIYQKLDVHDRIEAINRAIQLNLLD
ncbi:MAG: hypothetical protein JW908_13435 [Anaerolineales bacterium]|nr:hypothetical protein [Anaerolineales bacterium]